MSNTTPVKKQGIMICGHGSRDKDAEREFGLVAKGLKKRFPHLPVEYGFLEFSAPNIHMGLNSLLSQGVEEIYAVPGMLFAATHAKNDIPSVLTTYEKKNAGLHITYGRELGLQDDMIEAFQARIYESLGLDSQNPPANLYDTLLVVVGRGTSDTSANAEAAKLTRIVNENMGFGWADTVYSGVTYPSVGVGLENLMKLDYKRIVIAPYFLFTGRLIKRIQGYVDKVAQANPTITFIQTPYLSDHSKVIDAFQHRVEEIMQGDLQTGEETLMNSFKRRLAAGEVDVHHHHAEFVDPQDDTQGLSVSDHEHSHDHGHPHDHSHDSHSHDNNQGSHPHDHSHDSHSHDNNQGSHSHDNNHSSHSSKKSRGHGHSHGVYKHIGHPMGPRTMIGEGICCCFMGQFTDEILEEEKHKIDGDCTTTAFAHK